MTYSLHVNNIKEIESKFNQIFNEVQNLKEWDSTNIDEARKLLVSRVEKELGERFVPSTENLINLLPTPA